MQYEISIFIKMYTLTHYSPMLFFYTHWKHQKTFVFRFDLNVEHHSSVFSIWCVLSHSTRL